MAWAKSSRVRARRGSGRRDSRGAATEDSECVSPHGAAQPTRELMHHLAGSESADILLQQTRCFRIISRRPLPMPGYSNLTHMDASLPTGRRLSQRDAGRAMTSASWAGRTGTRQCIVTITRAVHRKVARCGQSSSGSIHGGALPSAGGVQERIVLGSERRPAASSWVLVGRHSARGVTPPCSRSTCVSRSPACSDHLDGALVGGAAGAIGTVQLQAVGLGFHALLRRHGAGVIGVRACFATVIAASDGRVRPGALGPAAAA